MKPSDHIPEQIDDDPLLASLQKQCSLEPPAELDQRVKQMYREAINAQRAAQHVSVFASARQLLQQLMAYWRFFRQTPAVAATLLVSCLLTGLLSGLLLPSPWRDQQQIIQSVDTAMVLRNGSTTTNSQTTASGYPQLPAEQWLEIIAELLVQQRVEEAQLQLQAFRKRYPDLGVLKTPASGD